MSLKQTVKSITALSLAECTAGQRCQEVLINCYNREVAAPEGHLSVGPMFGQNDWPMAIKMARQRSGGQVMHLLLPFTGERLLAVVEAASATGNFRYQSLFFHKSPGKPWSLLEWRSLAALLLHELSLKYEVPPNTELMEQIRNSVAVTALVLTAPPSATISPDPVCAYIESEQSLSFGHPFHPAPKSRQGFSDADLRRYSPELRARFPLHWFSVRREDTAQQSLLSEPCDGVIARYAPSVEPDFAAVPVHPWQAGYLLRHPLVQEAINIGRMRYLGAEGGDFVPTSSIRTLYQPGNPYFYKFSLNIRITNCVRKNAWYELEGALQVTRLVRDLAPALYRQFPGVRILEEPAFLSVDLRDADGERNREVIEAFGMILRRSFEGQLPPDAVPLVAGALFGDHINGEARLRFLLDGVAQREAESHDHVAERWFYDYVAQLMYPVFYLYFAHGVIFEPHLQNVVLGVRDGWPRHILLRDFEGVKLVRERYSESRLSEVGPRAREALWYGDDHGWNRIAYCLFVNNFCEAISQIGARRPGLQQRLWSIVGHHLHHYQAHYGSPTSARRINALLSGQPFPGKANLINRFLKRPDRTVTYLPVTNPIARVGEGPVWS